MTGGRAMYTRKTRMVETLHPSGLLCDAFLGVPRFRLRYATLRAWPLPPAVALAMLRGAVHARWTRRGVHLSVPVSLGDIRRGWAAVPRDVRCAVHGARADRGGHKVIIEDWLRRGMVDAFLERRVFPADRGVVRRFLLGDAEAPPWLTRQCATE